MLYFVFFLYVATVTVILANPLPHGSNAKRLIDTRQVSAENPSDIDSSGIGTEVETEPIENLDSSTSSQNALVVADIVSTSDKACITDANADHLLDDNIQQGNIFRRKTPGYCPAENKLVPPRNPGHRFKITPSRQRLEGQTQRTTTTGDSPRAGFTGRLHEQRQEHVTCGGPEIGDDPNSIVIDLVVHCVKGAAPSVPAVGPFLKDDIVEQYCCNQFIDGPNFWMSFSCISLGTEPIMSPSKRWSLNKWREWSDAYLKRLRDGQ